MSERVFAFVEEWVSEHIHAQDGPPAAGPHADGPDTADTAQAAAFAQQCVQDAQAAGIPKSEIDDAFENLTDYIAAQIEEANERKFGEADDEDESDVPA